MFIKRTDVETEAPVLWPPNAKSRLIGKDRDAGKDWRQEKKEMTEAEMVGWHHQLLEFTQTHVHWVGDTIQPSHPLSSPSPPAFNLSQHQSLFKCVSSLLQVSKVLEFQLQPVLPMNTQDWPALGWTGWISLQSKGLSRIFSNTTVQKHQFFCTQPSLQSNSHIHTWPQEKP